MMQSERVVPRSRELVIGSMLWAALAAMGWFWLTGCRTEVKNQGEVGFRWGTEVTFFSRAAQTAPEPATAEIGSQPLNEWLERKAETPPTPETDTPNP
jgi:hypothetical protein